MASIVQSPLPVLSTKFFSVGPNERLSVQDFLRDIARSSRVVKVASRPQNEETIALKVEQRTRRQVSSNLEASNIVQSSPTNVSKEDPHLPQLLLPERLASENNTLPNPKELKTGPFRIVHTYSRKAKGLPPKLPTSKIIPLTSAPSVIHGDQQCDASLGRGSQFLAREPVEPGTHPDEPQPQSPPRGAKEAKSKPAERKPKRAAGNEIVNAQEEGPANEKKRRRRAPVEGLVLVHDIAQGVYPSEAEVSQDSTFSSLQ